VQFKRDSSWLVHTRNVNANRGISRAIDADTWEVRPNCSWTIQVITIKRVDRTARLLGTPLEWAELEDEVALFADIPKPLIRRFTETL
jgi:hypothetical protein